VNESALRTWLMAGLDDDDPDLAAAKAQYEDFKDRLAFVSSFPPLPPPYGAHVPPRMTPRALLFISALQALREADEGPAQ
jgi:hypothetical protein